MAKRRTAPPSGGSLRWRTFAAARTFVRSLGLKNNDDWRAYSRSGKRPDDIPGNPARVYRSDWISLGDWLGTGTVASRLHQYRSFVEARTFVHTLGLKKTDDWRAYCQSGHKPDDIPANPNTVYKRDWQGTGDWLGTGTIAPKNRQYRPFAVARAFVRGLGIRNQPGWAAYSASEARPDDIPGNPRRVYRSNWKGVGHKRTCDRRCVASCQTETPVFLRKKW